MSISDKLLKSAAAGGLTPSENFTTVTYSGNGGANAITGVGFKPDWVWIKQRDVAVEQSNLYDSTRGIRYFLVSNSSAAQVYGSANRLNAFDSDGFTLGSDNEINDSSSTYVAWCWKAGGGTTASNGDGSITSTVQANDDAGFSIVKYTGTGSNLTIGHGLSAAPDLVIVKNLDSAGAWLVQHISVGPTKAFYLETTNSATDNATFWNDTAPTATTVSIGTHSDGNASGDDAIAYCFRNVAGFSKFGSYEGNGAAYGPIVETGFEVGWLMIKNIDSADNWAIFDNKRDTTNPREKILQANLTAEESTEAGAKVNFLANGFQLAGTGGGAGSGQTNTSGETYIYLAFAADPDTEQPTLADSFGIKAYTGNATSDTGITGLGFKPNLVWIKNRSAVKDHMLFDSVRGETNPPGLYSNLSNAEFAGDANNFVGFDSDGFTIGQDSYTNGSGNEIVGWAWKANDDVPTIFGGPAKAVYKFEDDVDDVTGDYDGTANSITYAAGKFNQAAVFNGTDGDIDLSSDIESATMAVSLWAYLDDNAPTNQIIIEFDNGYGLNFPSFASGKLAAQYANSNTSHTLSNSTLSNGQWYHIAANFRSGATDLYIDGVKQTTGGTADDYLTADQNTIGSRRSGEFFDGMIDQVRIYNGNFQQIQIDELYNETTAENDDLELGGPPQIIVSVNANAGFSIVKFKTPASPGANTRVPHGLSAAPDMILIKRTDGVEDWYVYHTSMGLNRAMRLNSTIAEGAATNLFNTVNATVFNPAFTGTGNMEVIAYCFHSVTGYSKFGTYTGSGSAVTVTTGFQPDFVMIKTTGVEDWNILDSIRGWDKRLYPDLSSAETDESSDYITVASTTFRIDVTGNAALNNSGDTFIYAAFKIN